MNDRKGSHPERLAARGVSLSGNPVHTAKKGRSFNRPNKYSISNAGEGCQCPDARSGENLRFVQFWLRDFVQNEGLWHWENCAIL